MVLAVVPLGGRRGGCAVIDVADLPLVLAHRWFHDVGGYPQSTSVKGLRMHNLLLGKGVDHVNGDKLDNRRANLRPATQPQNAQNVRTAKGEYRGVYFDRTATYRPWYGQVKHRGVKHSAGYHATRDEARDAVRQLRASLLPYATA